MEESIYAESKSRVALSIAKKNKLTMADSIKQKFFRAIQKEKDR